MQKKKKTRYFEHYICNILKQVCPERDITRDAKSQLNELAILTCKLISKKIGEIKNKKTITENDVEASIKLIFDGQLSQKSIQEGKRCLQIYTNNIDKEGNSKKSKADLLIPPSMLEKFLRPSRISNSSPIFLAGVIEYFLAQVIELSNLSKKGVRITLNDLENGIRSDKEIDSYFTKNNIYFFKSGMAPFIHPQLKGKDIKMYQLQEDNKNIFPKTVIEDKIKNYISLIYPEIRYQKDCFSYIHDYLEKWLVEILQSTNNLTLYSKKKRVSASDIELVLSIIEKRNPDFLEKVSEEDCMVFTT